MTVFVDIASAIKFTVLKIQNRSGRSRNLSATGYVEWVLGDNRMKTAMFIRTEVDPDSGALFAKNQYNTEFKDKVAFFDVDYLKKTSTGDRTEFIGRNGNLQNPRSYSPFKTFRQRWILVADIIVGNFSLLVVDYFSSFGDFNVYRLKLNKEIAEVFHPIQL